MNFRMAPSCMISHNPKKVRTTKQTRYFFSAGKDVSKSYNFCMIFHNLPRAPLRDVHAWIKAMVTQYVYMPGPVVAPSPPCLLIYNSITYC